MLERFLVQPEFRDMDDFRNNLEFDVPEHFNFALDVMDVRAWVEPDRTAMLWVNDKGEEKSFSYADLKRISDKTAGFLSGLGIGKGDIVMLILKRRYQFWTTMLALEKLGAIAVPASFLLTENDIVYRCKSAEIKALICCGETSILDRVTAAEPKCPYLEHLISIGPEVPEGWIDFEEGVRQASPWRHGVLCGGEEPMLMYFTSGTSDEPKMVLHSHTYALSHLVTAAFWHDLKPSDLHLTYSDTGWGKAVWGKMYGQWIVGCCVFVYDHERFSAAELLEVMARYKVTSFCAPPTIYRFMIQEDFSKYDLSALKKCCTAGEALNPSVFEEFRKRTGIMIREAFGQTETTLTIGTFPWMEPRPGSMGKPNPAYDVDIVGPDGKSTAPGEQGVIIIRTGNKPIGLFKCYYRNPKLTRKAWNNDVYVTGDVAYRDEDGYFWFVGRNDDLIKTSGYRVSPFEVESAIMGHRAVVECAVTGVPDPEGLRGTVVKATVVLSSDYKDHPDKAGLAKDIQDYVKRVTAPYKYPRVIEFVSALPKTISGKIRHVEIRRRDTKS